MYYSKLFVSIRSSLLVALIAVTPGRGTVIYFFLHFGMLITLNLCIGNVISATSSKGTLYIEDLFFVFSTVFYY